MLTEGIARLIGNYESEEGVVGLVYDEVSGANVFVGSLPSSPDRCVAVIPTGGYESDSKLPYDSPTFQIMVRGDEDALWALTTAQDVYDLLQGYRNRTLPDRDSTYVVSIIAIQSGPAHVGDDDNGRVQYSMNFETETKNPTRERPDHGANDS